MEARKFISPFVDPKEGDEVVMFMFRDEPSHLLLVTKVTKDNIFTGDARFDRLNGRCLNGKHRQSWRIAPATDELKARLEEALADDELKGWFEEQWKNNRKAAVSLMTQDELQREFADRYVSAPRLTTEEIRVMREQMGAQE